MSIPAANPQRIERMRALLEAAFAPAALEIVDDSHRHIGHAGARDGHGHFSIDVVSNCFEGLSPVARHRAVYAVLGTMLSTDIHALSIKAATPGERA